ncbi:MAG TPA: hypothetical protein VK985_04445 [Rariglobus sp.]|nr:hypothetical protein [Rariglobus sp.]
MKSWFLLLCISLVAPVVVHAEFSQLGPVETLDNGVVTLQVALRVGRVVAYQRSGEVNWLAVHDVARPPGWDCNPWGGDHIWPTIQSLNPQIYGGGGFDPVIDGAPWDILHKSSASLEIRSGISPHLGLRITHRIELIGKTTGVMHTYRLEQLADGKFPVHVWAVTGVRKGDYVLMEADPRGKHERNKPYRSWMGDDYKAEADARLLPGIHALQVSSPDKDASKAGSYGRWIALVDGGSAFLQNVDYIPSQVYLDSSNLQTYNEAGNGIHELETLSPSWLLRKGETRDWSVHWSLVDFPEGTATPSAKAAFLSGLTPGPLN